MTKNAIKISISHLNNTTHFKIFALQVKLFNEHFFDLEHGRKTCIDAIFCADLKGKLLREEHMVYLTGDRFQVTVSLFTHEKSG